MQIFVTILVAGIEEIGHGCRHASRGYLCYGISDLSNLSAVCFGISTDGAGLPSNDRLYPDDCRSCAASRSGDETVYDSAL